MTLAHVATGTVAIATSGASNPITCSPAWPSHSSGNLGVLTVVSRHDTEATPTVTAGGGETWTQIGSGSGGGGTFGAGTGPARITLFRTTASSGSMATPTVNLAGTNTGRTLQAVITVYSRTAETDFGTSAVFVAEATAGTSWTQAHTSDPGITSGDMLHLAYGVRDDQAVSFTAMGVTATGATISSVTERADSFTGEGNDAGLGVGTTDVTAGTASAVATQTATIGASETGMMALLRIREITPKTTAPTLIAYQETTWSGATTPKNVDASISWQDGDEIYAVGMTADSGATLGTPTVSGLTFNAIGSNPVGGGGAQGYKWKAVASASSSGTVQFSRATGDFDWGGAIWQYRGSDGTGNTATNAGSALTVSLTRGDDHSAVVEILGDFDAGTVTGRDWTPTGETEREGSQISGNYSILVADWGDQGTAGATSYGVTGLSGTYTIIAIEVQGTTGGDATATPAVIATTAALPASSLNVTAGPAVTATTAALPQASAGVSATPTPAVVAASTALPRADVNVVAGPAVAAATVALPAPTVSAGGSVSREPATIAATVAVPDAARNVAAGPGVIASTTTLPNSSRNVTAGPAAIAATVAMPEWAVNSGAGPDVIPVVVGVPQATPQAGGNATATPAAVAATVAVPAVTVSGAANATPAVIPVVVSLPAPTVSAGGNVTTTPAVIAATSALPQASVNVTVGATVVAATVALPTPTVGSVTTATPATVTATAALPQPAVNVRAGPAVIPVTVSLPAASAGSPTNATPAVVAATVTLPATQRHIGAGPAAVQVVVSLPALLSVGSGTFNARSQAAVTAAVVSVAAVAAQASSTSSVSDG